MSISDTSLVSILLNFLKTIVQLLFHLIWLVWSEFFLYFIVVFQEMWNLDNNIVW